MSKVLCISREYGSGGHEIGKKAAEMLGVDFYDKVLIDQAVEESGFSRRLVEDADEKRGNPIRYTAVNEGKYREFYGMSPNDAVFELEKRAIRKAAGKGDCIIVGRCAEEVLKETGHLVVSVFITAPIAFRVERKAFEMQETSLKTVESQIRKVDKQRKSYYEYHTGKEWGIPYHYDVCLNSETVGIAEITELIVSSFNKITREGD